MNFKDIQESIKRNNEFSNAYKRATEKYKPISDNMNKLHCFIRAVLGIHNVDDGTTCEISKKLWNVHDYHKNKGGDGIPAHLCDYTCPKCGKEFTI